MPEADTFAGRLQELREAKGLSQYELARRTGLSKQTLSKLEMGDRDPSWTTVRLLAHVLGVSVTAFEAGELPLPEPKPPARRGRPRRADQVASTPATE
jgi:transcriptional regulator with XRE-family HTH domain